MNSRQQRTFNAIFTRPAPANVRWNDVVSLLVAMGAEMVEGEGSRVWFHLDDESFCMHRPHPGNELSKPAVRSVREFLGSLGYGPDNRPD